MKKIVLTAIAIMCSLCTTVNAQRVTSFDYSSEYYRFGWTDENGEVHSNLLTDKATDPDHILALFAKVYATPEIPGLKYFYDESSTDLLSYDSRAHQTYTSREGNDNNYIDWLQPYVDMTSTPKMRIPNPYEDGKTVLLVEVNPTWKSSMPTANAVTSAGTWNAEVKTNRDFVKACYKSVQLLSSFMRVSDVNNGGNNPGYMFYIDNLTTNRFFYVSKGRSRDSASYFPLWGTFEEISPTASSGDNLTTKNLASQLRGGNVYKCVHSCGTVPGVGPGHEFTITDGDMNAFNGLTLFLPDKRLTGAGTGQSSYHGNFQPRVFLYKVELQANVKPSETHDGYYDITLDWESNFTKEKIGADALEQFYVYKVNEDGTYTLLKEVDNTMETPTRSLTHTYEWPQEQHVQTFRYIVCSNPIEEVNGEVNESQIFVYSNVDRVTIPGKDAFFSEAQEYRSRFDAFNELNLYKNTVALNAGSANDFKAIDTDLTYELKRTSASEDVVAATLKFTKNEDNTYSYVINYNDEAQDIDNTFDNNYTKRPLSGTIASESDKIELVDYFNASTSDNTHPDSYSYILTLQDRAVSNSGTVPVYKTYIDGSLDYYTLEEVSGDIDGTMNVTSDKASLTFNGHIDVDQNIKRYDIYDITAGQLDPVANAQCEGTTLSLIQYGEALDVCRPGVSGKDLNVPTQVTAQTNLYVTKITANATFGTNTVENTYGTKRATIESPDMKIKVGGLIQSHKWFDVNTNEYLGAYSATLDISPILPEHTAPNVYYFRVWRVEDNGKTLLLNTLADTQSTDGWATTYSNVKTYFPTGDPSVCDVYFGLTPTRAAVKEASYVVRMYSTNVSGAHGIKLADTDGSRFYITERQLDVRYSGEGVITAINGLEADVKSVKYHNTLGIESDTPFKGINIVVTTYNDGRTVTTKVVM